MDNSKKQLNNLEKDLYKWFKATYEKRVSIDKLYEKGSLIKERIERLNTNFFGRKSNIDLQEALTFIDNLHDSSTREYHSKHNEEIYYYMKKLA